MFSASSLLQYVRLRGLAVFGGLRFQGLGFSFPEDPRGRSLRVSGLGLLSPRPVCSIPLGFRVWGLGFLGFRG